MQLYGSNPARKRSWPYRKRKKQHPFHAALLYPPAHFCHEQAREQHAISVESLHNAGVPEVLSFPGQLPAEALKSA